MVFSPVAGCAAIAAWISVECYRLYNQLANGEKVFCSNHRGMRVANACGKRPAKEVAKWSTSERRPHFLSFRFVYPWCTAPCADFLRPLLNQTANVPNRCHNPRRPMHHGDTLA